MMVDRNLSSFWWFLWLSLLVVVPSVLEAAFELNLVHLNHIPSSFFETDDHGLRCNPSTLDDAPNCNGGLTRQVAKIKEIRSTQKNVLVLANGNFFLESSSYPLRRWKLAASMIPLFNLNATSLEKRDFDLDPYETAAFLLSLNCPVLCSNLVRYPGSFWEDRVNASTIFNIDGEKVGIIGFIPYETQHLARAAEDFGVQFEDEKESVEKEVRKMKDAGVNKIIVLGKSEEPTSSRIFYHMSEIDLLIGTDSNIFMRMSPEGPFQAQNSFFEDRGPTGKSTVVLKVARQRKGLGLLKVTFDETGMILNYSSNTAPIDREITPDSETQSRLNQISESLTNAFTNSVKRLPAPMDVLGSTAVELVGDHHECNEKECTLGNFITDAMIHAFVHFDIKPARGWNEIDAAIWNSGRILRSINPGNITMNDLTHAISTGDFVSLANVTGTYLKALMENSVAKYDPTGLSSASSYFLQVSGLKVEYDLKRIPGHRVASLKVRCSQCDVPQFVRLHPERHYRIVLPNSLMRSGNGFPMQNPSDPRNELEDINIFVKYLKDVNPIVTALEDRIEFRQRKFPFRLQKVFYDDGPREDSGASFDDETSIDSKINPKPSPLHLSFKRLEKEDAHLCNNTKRPSPEMSNNMVLEDAKRVTSVNLMEQKNASSSLETSVKEPNQTSDVLVKSPASEVTEVILDTFNTVSSGKANVHTMEMSDTEDEFNKTSGNNLWSDFSEFIQVVNDTENLPQELDNVFDPEFPEMSVYIKPPSGETNFTSIGNFSAPKVDLVTIVTSGLKPVENTRVTMLPQVAVGNNTPSHTTPAVSPSSNKSCIGPHCNFTWKISSPFISLLAFRSPINVNESSTSIKTQAMDNSIEGTQDSKITDSGVKINVAEATGKTMVDEDVANSTFRHTTSTLGTYPDTATVNKQQSSKISPVSKAEKEVTVTAHSTDARASDFEKSSGIVTVNPVTDDDSTVDDKVALKIEVLRTTQKIDGHGVTELISPTKTLKSSPEEPSKAQEDFINTVPEVSTARKVVDASTMIPPGKAVTDAKKLSSTSNNPFYRPYTHKHRKGFFEHLPFFRYFGWF